MGDYDGLGKAFRLFVLGASILSLAQVGVAIGAVASPELARGRLLELLEGASRLAHIRVVLGVAQLPGGPLELPVGRLLPLLRRHARHGEVL